MFNFAFGTFDCIAFDLSVLLDAMPKKFTVSKMLMQHLIVWNVHFMHTIKGLCEYPSLMRR